MTNDSKDDLKSKYFQWKVEGYEVASLEPHLDTDNSEGTKAFEEFEKNVGLVKKMEEDIKLLAEESEGFEEDIQAVRNKLKNPTKTQEIARDIHKLKGKVKENMFVTMMQGGFHVIADEPEETAPSSTPEQSSPATPASTPTQAAVSAPAQPTPAVPAQPKNEGAEIKPGFSYLMKDDTSEKTYEIFKEYINSHEDVKGMIITRDFPENLRKTYGFKEDMQIFWLSNMEKDFAIKPVDLGQLFLQIESFINEYDFSFILLSGMEYLITQNNYVSVLKFLQLVNEQVAVQGAALLVPISPATLDTQDLKLIERELKVINK